MLHPLRRYSPLIEILAVFVAFIAAQLAASLGHAHREAAPPVARAKPAPPAFAARLDPFKLASLTGLPATERVCPELASLDEIGSQARIVPSFRDGHAVGFKLFAIRPGSIYAEAGLKNGDVVKTINGYDLTAPDKALETYSVLKAACRYDIELERGGQTMHLLCVRRRCMTQ